MRRLKYLMLAFIIALLCSGCLNSTALDEYGYVLSVGVDAGETQRFNVSFLIQQTGESQESQAGAGSLVISAEGDSIYEAISIAHLGVPYELNFTRTNYLAFSRDTAKDGLMAEFLKASFEALGLRDSVKLVIVLGECSEYFDGLYSEDNPSVAKRQYSLFQNLTIDGVIPMTNLSLFREAVDSARFDAVMAVGMVDTAIESQKGAGSEGGEQKGSSGSQESQSETGPGTTTGVKRSGGMRSYSRGSAVFNGDKLVGVLNGEDTEMLLMATGKFVEGRLSFKDDKGEYSFKLMAVKPPVTNIETGSEPCVKLNIALSARVELDTAGDAGARWDTVLCPALENYIEGELERVFMLCRDAGSDAMAFGKCASQKFASVKEWHEYDWKAKYLSSQASFNVTISPEETAVMKGGG